LDLQFGSLRLRFVRRKDLFSSNFLLIYHNPAKVNRIFRYAGLDRHTGGNELIWTILIDGIEDFPRAKNMSVHRLIALDTKAGAGVSDDSNSKADLAIFALCCG
jgi:hypothetical protein